MGEGRQRRPKRPRGPGVAYSVVSLVLVLTLGLVAMTASQPPPPTIAEFAPQAVEQIEDAPIEQRSDAGASGAGIGADIGDGDRLSADPANLDPVTIDVPRVRRCVGDPPRQIEDPQSPPCVPYWEGDNGGITHDKGVTRDEIRIAVPTSSGLASAFERFFNSRFEFYGRRLRLFGGDCYQGSPEAVDMQASAVCVDEELGAFASTDYLSGGGLNYFLELARRRVISVSATPNFDDDRMRRLRPYLWQYPASTEQVFANVGEWTCVRLSQGSAVHAGDPLLQSEPRRFGLVVQQVHEDSDVSSGALERQLSRCGAEPETRVEYCTHCEGNTNAFDPTKAMNAVAQMKAAGVTTVICLCNVLDVGNLPRAATQQAWFPEWLISTYILQDSISFIGAFARSPEQLENTFGLRFLPKAVQWADNPYGWALREADPDYPEATHPADGYAYSIVYRSLLLLASGIQMAGPNLTPYTFEDALHRTLFPNPDHPIMAGHVGFDDSRGYSMTNDATEIWWSNQAGNGGAYCYVDGGVRHRLGSWPHGGDPFFTGPCDPGGANE